MRHRISALVWIQARVYLRSLIDPESYVFFRIFFRASNAFVFLALLKVFKFFRRVFVLGYMVPYNLNLASLLIISHIR